MPDRTRRALIQAVGTACFVGLAGCSSTDEESVARAPETPDTTSEPTATSTEQSRPADGGAEATVRAFFTAARNDDVDAANEHIHPDAPDGYFDRTDLSDSLNQYTVEATDITNQSDRRTTVEATVSSPDTSETAAVSVELRIHDGDWHVYDTSQ